jgi:hypothetical protein
MTIIEIVKHGNAGSMLLMAVIIAGILAMMAFFYNELKKAHGEKKNDSAVGSAFSRSQQSGNSAVTAAISAAVNEYRKTNK